MCTLPPKRDCGSLIALALLRADPDSGWFEVQANFALSDFCVCFKTGGVFSNIMVRC